VSGFQQKEITAAGKESENTAEVFSHLYEEHFPKVYRYISYQVTDSDVAEDLTSAVWEKALSKFQTYDSRRAAFSTWVLTIARNTVTDFFRENRKQQNMQIETIRSIQPNPSPDEAIVKEEEIRLLKSFVSRLSRQEQEIISFKFGSELTNREIAGTLGLSESNVAVIIFRAVRKLREQFLGEKL
jgi:RNA polymerase sigma factor (sigma-70 family)